MLVIISDLHLTDTTTSSNVSAKAFKDILGPEIIAATKKAATKELHIILLGDIYDLVRTDYWVQVPSVERPWNGILDRTIAMNPHPNVEKGFNAVLTAIFSKTKFLADMLKTVITSCGNIPTKITYVIGNHDRVLNNFQSLQAAIQNEFGYSVTFANYIEEPTYGVHARHGHEWDENCNAFLLLH